MKTNTIVKHYAGSHAYGTALPTSDVDFRGVFVADPINILTPFFPVRECEDVDEEDTKLYELAHFMKLCLDCNPNIIETLWIDVDDITFVTPAYVKLRDHRHKLLSSKIAFTTSGYALAQLKRIRGHNKWLNNPQSKEPPTPREFLAVVQWFGDEKNLNPNVSFFCNDHRLVPYGGNAYGVYHWPGYRLWDANGNFNDRFEESREGLGPPLMVVKWNKEEYKTAKERHEQYWTWKKNRNETRATLEEEHGYDCYSDDTEFLTNNGWKKYDDVDDHDLLATFNQYTHKIEYQTPLERFDGTFTGNLYHFTGQHTDVLVTPNHNMYIKEFSCTLNKHTKAWDFIQAAQLPECFDTLHTITPKTNRQTLPEDFNTNVLKDMTLPSYLRVLGWYISDGTCHFTSRGEVSSVMISQSKPQSRLTQNLTRQRNLGRIVCETKTYPANGIANFPERRWYFRKNVSKLIYLDCGHKSECKRIPQWCFNLTKREMNILLTALLQGDGTKKNHKEETYVYYTCNSALADDVQRLAFLCGFETSKWGPHETPNTFNKNLVMYQVHINKRAPKTKRRYRSNDNIQKIPVKNQRIVCFMVPNHTLVTRRNGKVALHANSKHAMHLVRLLRMGVEALRDGEIVVKRPDAEELLAIRNGAWTYEEIVDYAEMMDKEVREVWYKQTSLTKKPDIKFAAQLLMEIQDMVWSNEG